MNKHTRQVILGVIVVLSPAIACAQSLADARNSAKATSARIRRADYEGDRAALRRLHAELTPLRSLTEDRRLASRVRYWQGFAMWRRAINGFNEAADPEDLERDLRQAILEFDEAVRTDPTFVDAMAGIISCLGYLSYLHRDDAARIQELVPRLVRMLEESLAAAPENPRLLWVQGPTLWYARPGLSKAEIAERQGLALATYEKALGLARAQRGTDDPLEPSWGEPELLMNLAWSNLNRTPPDVHAAEKYATQALALVPDWHYVRDILMPQIRRAADRR